jgi:exonuclease SbcC
MIIEALQISNFKRFKSADIGFDSGITGITGNNGVGKSSIVDAIFFALYGLQSGLIPDNIVSAFATERCGLYLRFKQGSDTCEIARSYSKTKQHNVTIKVNGEMRAEGVTQADAEIRKILGMGSLDFKNTVYAAQKDLMLLLDLTPGKRREWFLRALGIDYLNKGSQEILKAEVDGKEKGLGLLEGELAALTREGSGDVEAVKKELATLKTTIETLLTTEKEKLKERVDLSSNLAAFNSEKEEHNKLISTETSLTSDIKNLSSRKATLASQLDPSSIDISELDRLKKILEQLPAAKEYAESYRIRKTNLDMLTSLTASAVKEKDGIVSRIAKVDANIAKCESDEKDLGGFTSKVLSDLGLTEGRSIEDSISEFKESASSEISALNSRTQTIKLDIEKLKTNLKALVESGKEGTCPICRQPLGDHFDTVKNDYLDRIGDLETEKSDISVQLDTARNELQKVLTLKPTLDKIKSLQISISSKSTYEKDKAALTIELGEAIKTISDHTDTINALGYIEKDHIECKKRLEDLEKAQSEYNNLIQKSAQQTTISAQIKEIETQILQKTTALEEIKTTISVSPFDLTVGSNLDIKIKELDLALKTIGQDLATSNERERALTQKISDLEATASHIIEVQKQIATLKEEIEILKLTRAAISDYVIYIMQAVRSRIESEVSTIISEITGGKYDRVLLDEDFNLLIRENDKEYSVDRFSGGEQDDIAVALRIALSRYLAELHQVRESTLLIFDEIFGSQDEDRRANLLTALRSQKSHFPQILLISHIAEIQGEFENTLMVKGEGEFSTVTKVN